MPENTTHQARPRVVVVMPAYNAEKTLEKTISDIPRDVVDHLILVDDASTDNTPERGKKLGLEVITHETNRGYGANQKTCYTRALETDAEIIIMLHPDFQYDPRLIPSFIQFISTGVCDVMLGCRIRTRKEALDGGMPIWKYFTNRMLTLFENILLAQNMGDFHSGFRAYRREVLEQIPFDRNSDDFVFDSQFLAQCVHKGFKLGDAPVPVRYFDEASSINFIRSFKYGCLTVWTMFLFSLANIGIYKHPVFRD